MNQPQARAQARKRQKGPRPQHVPQRTCVACREKGDKRGLIRIVRSPEGEIAIDPTGKRNGRGAYLCNKPGCWRKALDTPILAGALNADIPEATERELQEYAAALEDGEASKGSAAAL
ncbi:MAG TPA: YlxR family protein [Thermomicrobiales bacterium]|nr:YlxR family protein [Thermomicrobiales bacterium]